MGKKKTGLFWLRIRKLSDFLVNRVINNLRNKTNSDLLLVTET